MKIFWKGEEIGKIKDAMCDMGYWEGVWEPESSSLGSEFTSKALTFEYKAVIKNPEKGTRIMYGESEPIDHALVLGIIDGTLVFRMVYDPEAIEILMKTVPE